MPPRPVPALGLPFAQPACAQLSTANHRPPVLGTQAIAATPDPTGLLSSRLSGGGGGWASRLIPGAFRNAPVLGGKGRIQYIPHCQLDKPCQSIAIDPNNADHLIVNNASNGAQ